MSKIIKVKILDDENHNDFCRLYDSDIPNISKKFAGKIVSVDDYFKALGTVLAYIYCHYITGNEIAIKSIDDAQVTVKEMTLEEIEEELGHKVKIVSDKENKNGCY